MGLNVFDKCTIILKLYYALLKKARRRARDPIKLKALKARWVCNEHHIIPVSCEKFYMILGFLKGKIGETICLTYREHERIHIYLIDIAPNEEMRAKMQNALLTFYDKHGIVFSEKEKKRHRDAGSAALSYRNTKHEIRGRLQTGEARNGDKHASCKPEFKGKTQVITLWGDKAETDCLLIIVTKNGERRIFGGFPRSPKDWGKKPHFTSRATAKHCYWFKYFDHYTIKEYRTRLEAAKARAKLEKKLKPRFKGQFNLDHILTYRAQCKYEKLSSDEKHLIQTGGYNGQKVDHRRSKKSLSERFDSRVAF